MPTLTGPSLPPAARGAPRQLVVFLHGYGADGADLIGLAPFFARALPHAEFVAPNAPEPCGMGFGYQWFGITNLDPVLMVQGVARASRALDAFLDEALAARGLGSERLALVGFSQGTMMALDRALRRGDSASAIVGFSGMIAEQSARLPEDAKRPPILLVHGTADPIVPFERLEEARRILAGARFPVETMVRPGLAHGIDPEGAQRAVNFLVDHLPAA